MTQKLVTEVIVPWYVLVLILLLIALLAWVLVPPVLLKDTEDLGPDEWWTARMESLDPEEAQRRADDYRDLAKRLRRKFEDE